MLKPPKEWPDPARHVAAIGRDPPADWSVERQRQYVQWGRDVVAGLRDAAPELEARFAAEAGEAGRRIDGR